MDEARLVHHKYVAGKVPFCTHSVISSSVFFRRQKLHIIFTLSESFKNTHTPSLLQTATNVLRVSVRLMIILRTPTSQTRHRSSQMNTDTFQRCVRKTDSVSERIIQLHTEIGRNTLYRQTSRHILIVTVLYTQSPQTSIRGKLRAVPFTGVHAVTPLVEALRHKPGFDSRWCHWNFSLTYSLRPR